MKNKTLKSFLMIVSCISFMGTITWNVNAIENDSIELNPTTTQFTEDISLPFELTIDSDFQQNRLVAIVKLNYSDNIELWDAKYLNDMLNVTNIESVKAYPDIGLYEGRHCVFFDLSDDSDKETTFTTAQKLYNTGWFYNIQTEDISISFNGTIKEGAIGNCILTFVKFNYSEDAKNWDSDYLNNLLSTTNVKSVKPIFTDQFTGRLCLFIYPTNTTIETSAALAQKLYNTDLFYSVDINYEDTKLPSEEIKGDATGDGKVDIIDVITINKAILGKEILSTQQLKSIDFNNNGQPDSEEALILMKYIVGLISEL